MWIGYRLRNHYCCSSVVYRPQKHLEPNAGTLCHCENLSVNHTSSQTMVFLKLLLRIYGISMHQFGYIGIGMNQSGYIGISMNQSGYIGMISVRY